MNTALILAARLLMSQVFIISGWSKVLGYRGIQAYFVSLGLPAVAVPLVILIELGGGILLLFGIKARWAAGILALFSLVSAFVAHTNFADPNQVNHFMKNLAMAGGYLLFVRYGAGVPSLDESAGGRR